MPWNRAQKRAPPVRCGEPRRRDSLSQGIEETCFAAVAKAAKKKASWPVSRVLYGSASGETKRGSHSSGAALARSLVQPTRTTRLETGWALARPCRPYSVLLPVGFAVPSMSPCPRWALTPPFHPYSASGAVCFLWHFPWGRPRRTLSGTVFPWSPDFPRPAAFRHLRGAAARPTGRGSLNDRDGKRQRNRHGRAVRRLLSDTRPRSPFRTRPPRAGLPSSATRQACRSRRSSWQPGRCRL